MVGKALTHCSAGRRQRSHTGQASPLEQPREALPHWTSAPPAKRSHTGPARGRQTRPRRVRHPVKEGRVRPPPYSEQFNAAITWHFGEVGREALGDEIRSICPGIPDTAGNQPLPGSPIRAGWGRTAFPRSHTGQAPRPEHTGTATGRTEHTGTCPGKARTAPSSGSAATQDKRRRRQRPHRTLWTVDTAWSARTRARQGVNTQEHALVRLDAKLRTSRFRPTLAEETPGRPEGPGTTLWARHPAPRQPNPGGPSRPDARPPVARYRGKHTGMPWAPEAHFPGGRQYTDKAPPRRSSVPALPPTTTQGSGPTQATCTTGHTGQARAQHFRLSRGSTHQRPLFSFRPACAQPHRTSAGPLFWSTSASRRPHRRGAHVGHSPHGPGAATQDKHPAQATQDRNAQPHRTSAGPPWSTSASRRPHREGAHVGPGPHRPGAATQDKRPAQTTTGRHVLLEHMGQAAPAAQHFRHSGNATRHTTRVPPPRGTTPPMSDP